MRNSIVTAKLLVLSVCCIVSMVAIAQHVSAPRETLKKGSDGSATFVFREIEPQLHEKTKIPLRLPTYLPGVDEQHPIFAVIDSADEASYEILLAVELPCEGQNNCTYGSVRGSSSRIEDAAVKGIRVNLKGGLRGIFKKAICHAYCDEATLTWKEGEFYYSVGMKAGKMKDLIDVANSALGKKP